MNTTTLNAAFYSRCYIAICNQTDSCPCLSAFTDNLFMTRSVENAYGKVRNFSVHSFRYIVEIFRYGCIKADSPLSSWTNTDFVHIHIRSMQEASMRSNSQNSNSAILSLSHQVCTFYRVNRNINRFSACTYMFSDVEHRCFIHFAFADNYRATYRCLGKLFMHAIYCQLVSTFLIPSAHKTAALDSCLFYNSYKFQ